MFYTHCWHNYFVDVINYNYWLVFLEKTDYLQQLSTHGKTVTGQGFSWSKRPKGRGRCISLGQCYQTKPKFWPPCQDLGHNFGVKTRWGQSQTRPKFGLKAEARRLRQRPLLQGRGQARPRPKVWPLRRGWGQNCSMEARWRGNFGIDYQGHTWPKFWLQGQTKVLT